MEGSLLKRRTGTHTQKYQPAYSFSLYGPLPPPFRFVQIRGWGIGEIPPSPPNCPSPLLSHTLAWQSSCSGFSQGCHSAPALTLQAMQPQHPLMTLEKPQFHCPPDTLTGCRRTDLTIGLIIH